MRLNLGLAAASAGLLILAYPHFDLAFLAPVAISPLVLASALEKRPARRFLLGWLAGVIYWAGACYWIQGVLEAHGSMSGTASWGAYALFSVFKALHMGVFALLAGLLMPGAWAVLSVPALWVAIESTHRWLGFAWLGLGNAGIDMGLPMRLAPWTGVWGLSFLFAMTGTVAALVALGRPRKQLAPVLALPLLLALPALPEPRRGMETAVLVQPNISEDADWTPQWVEDMHRRLDSLSTSSLAQNQDARLLVWPEMPAPMYYYESARFRERIDNLARTTETFVLLNVVPHDSAGAPLNSALLISPQGRPLARYDKMNLVPFGEFVPGIFKLLVAKVSSEAGDFTAGGRQVLLPAGGHRIGAFICYESVFPDFVRKFARGGADLFVNISNDGWYGDSAARYQHLEIARMRAAENRRWILRATNDGITSTIDPAGRVYVNLPSHTASAAGTSFSYIKEVTFYSRFGDWFVWLCAVGTVAALASSLRPGAPKKLTTGC
jgi:apolipoprotein N-acyltransferase